MASAGRGRRRDRRGGGHLQLIRVYPGSHVGEAVVDIAYGVSVLVVDGGRAGDRSAFEAVRQALTPEDVQWS